MAAQGFMSIDFQKSSQSCQTLDNWLHYIEQSHPQHQIELGLERVLQVAKRAQLHQLPSRVVLIAGTNGKGTTARCMEQLLLDSGHSVAVYSSPHLRYFNERLRLNQQDVADDRWVEAFAFIEQLRGTTSLTYFEFTTLAAFYLIKQLEPELALIEVGLGGRLDATNIVDPELSILTTIDLDHQEWLGHDRNAIGREKAGVFRPNSYAVVADLNVPQSVLDVAAEINTTLLVAGSHFSWKRTETDWQCTLDTVILDQLPLTQLPLQNCSTALMALRQMDLLPVESMYRASLAKVALLGRMQFLQHRPAILLDVAHNPQSIHYLAQQLYQFQPTYHRIFAVCGMLKDKTKADALTALMPLIDEWHLASLPPPRGASAKQVQTLLPSESAVFLHSDVASALKSVQSQLADDDLLLVFGSFVTVSAVLAIVQPLEAT